MTSHLPEPPPDLPTGWSARLPGTGDVPRLVELTRLHDERGRGYSAADEESVRIDAVGLGSWTRRHVLALDPSGRVQAWGTVHDRAAGRTRVLVLVDHQVTEADAVAGALYAWGAAVAQQIAAARGLEVTRLDADAYATDARQRRWLREAGYHQARTWLHMTRPVDPAEAHRLPGPRAGVTVRRVGRHEDGMPVAHDLQTIHRVLEESFQDHFNSFRESFPEFVQRLREDPGHRWDHWWVAEIQDGDAVLPAGGLVSSELGPDGTGKKGSYIDYIGVHRRARGRGVAKALLHTVIRDAAERGRNRVSLEVDSDSPTGADGLYSSMGWLTRYETESWHRDIRLG